jgi:hypothetical protein
MMNKISFRNLYNIHNNITYLCYKNYLKLIVNFDKIKFQIQTKLK